MIYFPTLQRGISIALVSFSLLSPGAPSQVGTLGIAKTASQAAQSIAPAPADDQAEASLTIYNQNLAVVRQSLPLQLLPGINSVHFTDTTSRVETDSVILRDPTGQHHLQVLEQSYRA